MDPKQAVETPELDQDLDFQAALLGLFGTGPLSSATASSKDGLLALQYARFWRLQSPMVLRITLGPLAAQTGEARVWLSRAYLEGIHVEHVMPPPQRVEAGAERLTYVFAVSQADQAVEVSFLVEPQRPGRVTGYLGLDGDTSLRFAQFIFP